VNTPTRLPDQLISPFFSFFAFTHEQQQSRRSAIAAVKPRRRLAHAPSQKRVGKIVCSSAVFFSTFSTF